ncbi:MAG: lipopolysaccharide assembly protein LapA domain-containing protein [Cyanobacteria bacterium P01_E01_bin.35]
MVLMVIVGLVMAILAVLFALQNAATVTINFGVWELEQSLAIVLITTLGLGIMISLFLSLPTVLKQRWQNSQQRKKIDSLQTKVRAAGQNTLQQQQYSLEQQSAIQELLQAFNLSDVVTGVLTKDTTIKLTEHLLQQMQNQSQNPRYLSLVVILISINPAKSQGSFAHIGSENALYKAIAKRLRNAVTAGSFLGITERKRFISLILGLRGAEVGNYAAYLQEKVTESPLQKVDGALLPFKMNIGGIVVEPTDLSDGRQILKQAEQNLENSLVTGYGSIEISEITGKSL